MFSIFKKIFPTNEEKFDTLTLTSDGNHTNNTIDKSDDDTPKQINIIKDSKKLVSQILKQAAKYHDAKSIFLSSEWTSEYDNDVSAEIKLYGSSDEFRLWLRKKNITKTIIKVKTGYDTEFTIDDNILKTQSLHDDILLHLESILGQLVSKTETTQAELIDLLTIKRNIRLWYKDSIEALATYPNYKDNFKKYGGDAYKMYEGRFIFKSDTADLVDIVSKFPDVDLIEIYDNKLERYTKYYPGDFESILKEN